MLFGVQRIASCIVVAKRVANVVVGIYSSHHLSWFTAKLWLTMLKTKYSTYAVYMRALTHS